MPSQVTPGIKMAAYNSLIPWVDHVRTLSLNAPAHVETLKLKCLSGTRYVDNVL